MGDGGHSPADGYSLFMANTVNAINNSLYQNLNFNFIADFAPIANEVLRRARQLNRVPLRLLARCASPPLSQGMAFRR